MLPILESRSGRKKDVPRYVLIATNPRDSDSFLVGEALHRKGVHAHLAHLSDFPSRSTASLYLDPDADQEDRWCLLDSPDLSSPWQPDAVWWRRPGHPVVPPDVHPEDREFVRQETTRFVIGLWQNFPQGTVYVNSPHHALLADRKPYQLQIARSVGFVIPPTLFSNNPEEIRSAIRNWGGRAIYKSFGCMNNFWWDSGQHKMLCLFTTAVDDTSLPDDDTLSLTPGIYQPLLPKAFELRVTVFGETVFVAKIFSQEQEQSRIDWRNGQRTLRYEAMEAPPGLQNLCVSLLRRLGLLMGCIDLIVSPEGKVVFLEINEGGQFLWLERLTGWPLLDAFSDFLIDPRPDFQWKPSLDPVRIQHVQAVAAEKKAQAAEIHLAPELPDYLQAALSPTTPGSTVLEEPNV